MDQAQQLRNVIKKQNQKVVKNTARVLTVTSGKGGVGKSNLSVNLAIQFRKMGKKVVIFDADFGLANVEVMFGAIPKHNLSDLIYRNKSIEEIITEGPMEIGFISGGSGILGLNNLTKEQIQYLVKSLEELSAIADIIIVDTGCGEEIAALLREYTEKIVPFTWCNDFSKARNAGLELATGQWFLYIDDEWFEDPSVIISFFKSGEYKKYAYANYIQRNYSNRE